MFNPTDLDKVCVQAQHLKARGKYKMDDKKFQDEVPREG